jgi:hypothetical protein
MEVIECFNSSSVRAQMKRDLRAEAVVQAGRNKSLHAPVAHVAQGHRWSGGLLSHVGASFRWRGEAHDA